MVTAIVTRLAVAPIKIICVKALKITMMMYICEVRPHTVLPEYAHARLIGCASFVCSYLSGLGFPTSANLNMCDAAVDGTLTPPPLDGTTTIPSPNTTSESKGKKRKREETSSADQGAPDNAKRAHKVKAKGRSVVGKLLAKFGSCRGELLPECKKHKHNHKHKDNLLTGKYTRAYSRQISSCCALLCLVWSILFMSRTLLFFH